ncbi:MAG: hypothetical protein ACR2QF_07005 [Geminicoccaceae bacterium]
MSRLCNLGLALGAMIVLSWPVCADTPTDLVITHSTPGPDGKRYSETRQRLMDYDTCMIERTKAMISFWQEAVKYGNTSIMQATCIVIDEVSV